MAKVPAGSLVLIQRVDGWFWMLDIPTDGPIGPFETKEEAVKDARETLGLKEGEQ
jgi:hypothetical protein